MQVVYSDSILLTQKKCGGFNFLCTVIYAHVLYVGLNKFTYEHVLHIQFSLMYDFLRTRKVFPYLKFSLLKNPENR